MKQLIIARKDLNMSPGKLAAQVSHASMAFLTWLMRQARLQNEEIETTKSKSYDISFKMSGDIMDDWICGSFVKIVCEAKNRGQLYKAAVLADSLGLKENKDYFIIRDNCLTELTPEDPDGRTPTCIGFRPLPDDICHQLSKKYQLYR